MSGASIVDRSTHLRCVAGLLLGKLFLGAAWADDTCQGALEHWGEQLPNALFVLAEDVTAERDQYQRQDDVMQLPAGRLAKFTGNGFLIQQDHDTGYILTAKHVVHDICSGVALQSDRHVYVVWKGPQGPIATQATILAPGADSVCAEEPSHAGHSGDIAMLSIDLRAFGVNPKQFIALPISTRPNPDFDNYAFSYYTSVGYEPGRTFQRLPSVQAPLLEDVQQDDGTPIPYLFALPAMVKPGHSGSPVLGISRDGKAAVVGFITDLQEYKSIDVPEPDHPLARADFPALANNYLQINLARALTGIGMELRVWKTIPAVPTTDKVEALVTLATESKAALRQETAHLANQLSPIEQAVLVRRILELGKPSPRWFLIVMNILEGRGCWNSHAFAQLLENDVKTALTEAIARHKPEVQLKPSSALNFLVQAADEAIAAAKQDDPDRRALSWGTDLFARLVHLGIKLPDYPTQLLRQRRLEGEIALAKLSLTSTAIGRMYAALHETLRHQSTSNETLASVASTERLASNQRPSIQVRGQGTLSPALYSMWSDAYTSPHRHLRFTYVSSLPTEHANPDSKQIAFTITDRPLDQKRLKSAGLIQIPITLNGAVPIINLPWIPAGSLVLNAPTLAAIYSGEINDWSDPRIKALNPELPPLPEQPITPVFRTDFSSTTLAFFKFLRDANPKVGWSGTFPTSPALPDALSASGDGETAQLVATTKGAIGYVTYSAVTEHQLPYVKLRQHDGSIVEPIHKKLLPSASTSKATAGVVAGAVAGAVIGGLLAHRLGASARGMAAGAVAGGATGGLIAAKIWPINTTQYVLIRDPAHSEDPVASVETLKFWHWIVNQGGESVGDGLDYVPLEPATKADVNEDIAEWIAESNG